MKKLQKFVYLIKKNKIFFQNVESQHESQILYLNENSKQKSNKFNTLDYKNKFEKTNFFTKIIKKKFFYRNNKLANAKFVMFSDEKQNDYYKNDNKRPSTFLTNNKNVSIVCL